MTTSDAIWTSYQATPDTHPNIPNNSFAGYRRGEAPIPDIPVVADVTACGARGDGITDDTAAFHTAIAQASRAGGGAVRIPAGTYIISSVLHLGTNGVVLRGDGSNSTTLRITRPLTEALDDGSYAGGKQTMWSWAGAFIWFAPIPPRDWRINGHTNANERAVCGSVLSETWLGGDAVGTVAAPARRGDRFLALSSASAARLHPGDWLLLTWHNDAGNTLLHHIAGHPRMRDYPWREPRYAIPDMEHVSWPWAVQIEKCVDGGVRLCQPLRLDIRPEWNVGVAMLGAHVSGCGVEGLSIVFPEHEGCRHCEDKGYNAVYFNRAVDCWARDLRVINADNAVGLSASKCVTVETLTVSGQNCHHGTATRVFTHDCLISDFRIETRPMHGVNVEGISSGNVWRKGNMLHGTFDSHRGMSLDCLYTDITLANDGTPGGNLFAGPFYGAHCVRWNIRLTPDADGTVQRPTCDAQGRVVHQAGRSEGGLFVYQPDVISDGALVGIRGAPMSTESALLWGSNYLMAPGDKNCLVADDGREPCVRDLYAAQLALRLSTNQKDR